MKNFLLLKYKQFQVNWIFDVFIAPGPHLNTTNERKTCRACWCLLAKEKESEWEREASKAKVKAKIFPEILSPSDERERERKASTRANAFCLVFGEKIQISKACKILIRYQFCVVCGGLHRVVGGVWECRRQSAGWQLDNGFVDFNLNSTIFQAFTAVPTFIHVNLLWKINFN